MVRHLISSQTHTRRSIHEQKDKSIEVSSSSSSRSRSSASNLSVVVWLLQMVIGLLLIKFSFWFGYSCNTNQQCSSSLQFATTTMRTWKSLDLLDCLVTTTTPPPTPTSTRKEPIFEDIDRAATFMTAPPTATLPLTITLSPETQDEPLLLQPSPPNSSFFSSTTTTPTTITTTTTTATTTTTITTTTNQSSSTSQTNLQQHRRHYDLQQYNQFDIYYQSLVHPIMLVHDHPERILVVTMAPATTGDDENCRDGQIRRIDTLLKHVLAHNTVKDVTILVVNDCDGDDESTSHSSTTTGVDDPRVSPIVYLNINDGIIGITTKRILSMKKKIQTGSLFDVLIVDDINPKSTVIETVTQIVTNKQGFLSRRKNVTVGKLKESRQKIKATTNTYLELLSSIIQQVSKLKLLNLSDSMMVINTGRSPTLSDPDETISSSPFARYRTSMVETIQQSGYQKILTYEGSSHQHPDSISSTFFVASMDNDKVLDNWSNSEARFNLKIRQRSTSSNGGDGVGLKVTSSSSSNSLQDFIDGATMISYRYPSKASQVVFCRRSNSNSNNDDDNQVDGCETNLGGGRGYNLNQDNIPKSNLEVKLSGMGEYSGRGVYTKVNIPSNTYIDLQSTANAVIMTSDTMKQIEKLLLIKKSKSSLSSLSPSLSSNSKLFSQTNYYSIYSYAQGYGCESTERKHTITVDPGIMAFINHGCNNTSNVDYIDTNVTEMTAIVDQDGLSLFPKIFMEKTDDNDDDTTLIYNPAIDHIFYYVDIENAKEIKVGEELLGNYLTYINYDDNDESNDWIDYVVGIRSLCMGSPGHVESYEHGNKHTTDVV